MADSYFSYFAKQNRRDARDFESKPASCFLIEGTHCSFFRSDQPLSHGLLEDQSPSRLQGRDDVAKEFGRVVGRRIRYGENRVEGGAMGGQGLGSCLEKREGGW